MDHLDVRPLSVENDRNTFHRQVHHIVVSIVFKMCVKDHGDSSSGLLERRI